MQPGWRWCSKCQVLAFAEPAPGPCAAGGSHDHSGSGAYLMAFEDGSLPAGLQAGWRWCSKCQVLAFSLPRAGPCAAGGTHDHSGSGAYLVAFGSAAGQQGWRWCSKCQVLAFSQPAPGPCVAGGTHDHFGSGAYVVAFEGQPSAPPITLEEGEFSTAILEMLLGAMQVISLSVGQGGTNREGDVRIVQSLLNLVPQESGGPGVPLVVDGRAGPKTISAIQGFQVDRFGWSIADGRVDPGGRTIEALNDSNKGPQLVDTTHIGFVRSDAYRSVAVVLNNRTNLYLGLRWAGLAHGVWTPGMEPPRLVEPQADGVWQSESAGFMTGTEGSARLSIGDTGEEFTITWNNPGVGKNTYSYSLDGNDWAIWYEGGGGDNSVIFFNIEPSKPHVVGFVPSENGFHFNNQWPEDTPILGTVDLGFLQVQLGDASNGLCGGMVFAARDYFQAGLKPPQQYVGPRGRGDPLFDYFVARLFDSFDLPNVPLRLLALMNPLTSDANRAAVMVREAWPAIKAGLDTGTPVPICLVHEETLDPLALGVNHQVLVYGYTLNGKRVQLGVYDPNQCDVDSVTISLDVDRADQKVVVDAPSLPHEVLCFSPMKYQWRDPPHLP